MENSTIYSCEGFPFQATPPCLLLNFREKFLAARRKPDVVHQRPPDKLTEEAVYMICVLLAFVFLAVAGSFVTVFEFLFTDNNVKRTKSKYLKNDSNKSVAKISETEQKSSEKGGFENCKSFLKCFCFLRNARKILNTTSAEGQVDSIQGLRLLSNIGIIIVHSGLFFVNIVKNAEDMKTLLELRAAQLLLNGMSVVNNFFVISGYLNSKSFFSKYSKNNGNISWFDFYFKRFMRLTPVYMIVLGVYSTLLTYTGSGIVWPTYNTNPICKRNWWWNLLYINNIGEASKECMTWCWYLAADMQFYIISPLFMISLLRWPRIGYALLITSISGAVISSFVLTYQNNLSDGFARTEFYLPNAEYVQAKFWVSFDIEYAKPYTRICGYLVGILLAYYLYKKQLNKDTTKIGSVTLLCGWIIAAIMSWIAIFSLYRREEILIETALFNSTKNVFISCSSAWIIYLCLTKQADFLDKCLSWKYLFPLARLTYCAYLVHPLVLIRLVMQYEELIDYSFDTFARTIVYISVLTYAISFIASLLFEIPMQNLLDWFGKQKREEHSSKPHSN